MSNAMIDALTLKNFKCHQNLGLSFRPLTILSGANATGKSSVIQSILMLEKSIENTKNSVQELSTDNIFGINLGLPSSIISSDHDNGKVVISAKIREAETKAVLVLQDAQEESLSFIIRDCFNPSYFPSILYLNAERVGPRISSGIFESLGLYVGSRGENTNYVMHQMDLLERKRPECRLPVQVRISDINRFSANCEAWLELIVPGTKLSTAVTPELNISTMKFRNKGDFYLPTATGFGITYVLPIIVQALAATTKKLENTILIVENPEAHLHPYSQSTIAKFLARIAACGVQVILETHSEHIINGCRLELAKSGHADLMRVIFFEENAGHASIGISSNGELEYWPKGFFDQTKADLRELLELRRCGK